MNKPLLFACHSGYFEGDIFGMLFSTCLDYKFRANPEQAERLILHMALEKQRLYQ